MGKMQMTLSDAELILRLKAVQAANGNLSKAAKDHGVNRQAFSASVEAAVEKGLTAQMEVQDERVSLQNELDATRKLLAARQREDETAEKIRQEIWGLAARTPEPPKWLTTESRPGKRGAPMCMLSDIHRGEVVSENEVGGVNKYNNDISRERIKLFVDRTIDLSYNHMGRAKTEYPGLICCFGGDMIGGDIHEELAKTNDRTTQQSINELTDDLGAVLETFGSKFGRVFVPCVVGNHGRSTKKMQMKQRVYTSHEWNIYCNLERMFRKDKRISFMIPSEADAPFTVFGHRFLLTHGDSLGVKGGDGIIGALGPIMRGSLKMHRSEAQIGRDFDTLVIGHWHQYLTLPGLIVNNAVKGYDEYARLALRAPFSRASQALWFCHPEHGITAHWQVYLQGQQTDNVSRPWVEYSLPAAE